MKKLVSLLLIILFFGCGIFSSINPPKWIIGSWESAYGTMTWTFTSDNIIMTSKLSDPIDFKEVYDRNEIEDAVKSTGIYEFTTFFVYKEYNRKDTYRFVQQSSNSLRYYPMHDKKVSSPIELFKK